MSSEKTSEYGGPLNEKQDGSIKISSFGHKQSARRSGRRNPLRALVEYWRRNGTIKSILLIGTIMYSVHVAGLFLLTFFRSAISAPAGGCWRDTPCRGPKDLVWPGIWEKYNYSPESRTISPKSILKSNWDVVSTYPKDITLQGKDDLIIFDFGKEVGGIITVTYGANTTGSLGLAFSEARNWTGPASDSSNGSFRPDGAMLGIVTTAEKGQLVMPDAQLRGGFRYLTVFVASGDHIKLDILDVQLEISFQPDWSNLKAYRGYFYSSDELLNRVWYGGAYTLQTNAIVPNQGRAWPILGGGWRNDGQCNVGSNESVIYVEGAKRDRTVWSGDLGIAVPSILVSTGDWQGVRNTLQVLYNVQLANGELAFAGPPITIYGSDTYHCITLIGTHDYFLFTGDQEFLAGIWDKYKLAVNFVSSKIDSTGMLFVTGTQDWGRLSQGGYNSEANMLMYRVLVTGSAIATWMGDASLSAEWSAMAARLKEATFQKNFDSAISAYGDSDINKSFHPQDANALALLYDAAPSYTFSSITANLLSNWNAIGAVAPELPDNHVGLIQSIEVKGHFAVNNTKYALELIRRAWGWYLNNPFGVASTFVEGYLSDGSFGYRSLAGYGGDYSYTSHAHGWSTGPTEALTTYIVGLSFIEPGGAVWKIAPQFGDLQHAEAGFMNTRGKWYAKWTLIEYGYMIEWNVPAGTKGTIVLPSIGGRAPKVVKVDGREITERLFGDADDGTVVVEGKPGRHVITVQL